MSSQIPLFGYTSVPAVAEDIAKREIRVLNWNIANPSIERAQRQLEWLIAQEANVLVLTEAKMSRGCSHIIEGLRYCGYIVEAPSGSIEDYCVLIATKGYSARSYHSTFAFLPHRIKAVLLETHLGIVGVMAVYVPSRGPKEARNVNKRTFQMQLSEWLCGSLANAETRHWIVCGDMNVVERDHVPAYSVFGEWEYGFYDSFAANGFHDVYRTQYARTQDHSWFGRYGDGYRFDHCFSSGIVAGHMSECQYDQAPRLNRLSDHAAMKIVFV